MWMTSCIFVRPCGPKHQLERFEFRPFFADIDIDTDFLIDIDVDVDTSSEIECEIDVDVEIKNDIRLMFKIEI